MRFLPIGGGLVRKAGILRTGQTTVYVAGDAGTYANLGYPKSYLILTNGQYAGTTNIVLNGKTCVKSNNCVVDLSSFYPNGQNPMWARYLTASIGPASDGQIPWTTTGSGGTAEGIWPYLAAVNAAVFAGYSDWRIPNDAELESLRDGEAPTASPDVTAFPTGWGVNVWTSNTRPSSTTNAHYLDFISGALGNNLKTANLFCALVRGGNP